MSITRSESTKQLVAALIAFHFEVGKISKDSSNPFYKSKYASLSNILTTIDPILASCDLTVIQIPIGENELYTEVAHVSGEYIGGSYIMTPKDNSPQSLGSVITYQRRYALAAALSLNIDDDDDGNAASKKSPVDSISAPERKERLAGDFGGIRKFVVSKIRDVDKSGDTLISKKTGRPYKILDTNIGDLFYFGSTEAQLSREYTVKVAVVGSGSRSFHTVEGNLPDPIDKENK